MFTHIKRIALPFAAIFFAMGAIPTAPADPVTFSFSGVLDTVYDAPSGPVLGGQFNVGDTFSGSFTFDDSAVGEEGSYYYNTPPNGLLVTINNLDFSSDPNNVQAYVDVENDQTNLDGEIWDRFRYEVREPVIFPVPTGFDPTIRIELFDSSATAFNSLSLPTDLTLAAWDSATMNISSEIGPFAWDFYHLSGDILTIELDAGLEVEIDIKPGSDPNCININGHGVIPVAILGSDVLDVSMVDQSTLSFGGLEVRLRGNRGPLCGLDDVNQDGYYDLVCHFEDNTSNWSPGVGEATLSGELLDDTPLEGTGSICVVP
jgi:hypothetical protein